MLKLKVSIIGPRGRDLAGIAFTIGVCLLLASCDSSGSPPPMGRVSSAIRDGRLLRDYTCDGDGRLPVFAVEQARVASKSLAIQVYDDTISSDVRTHYLAWGIRDGTGILPPPLHFGRNDFNSLGWSPPCPPKGELHRYSFVVYSLNADLDLADGARALTFNNALLGKVSAGRRVIAIYLR